MSSIAMRLFYDAVISRSAGEGGPGIDVMEWRRPLIAGDTVRVTIRVKSRRTPSPPARASASSRWNTP